MSSYKASLSKSDLYQMLSTYENRIQKKVQQIASKVINMSNIQPYNKQDNYKTNMVNPQKDKSIRSNSTFDAFSKPTGMFLSKNKIAANIENKLGQSHHLPMLKIDKNKSVIKQKINKSIVKPKYGKPKFVPRRPVILSKQIRNNPFSDPRPVPVSQLKQGLFNLMNKGIINRDVDISVAFQWGQAPFKSKGAIIHSYDQVVIHEQQLQRIQAKEKKEQQAHSFQSSIKNPSPSIAEKDGWAITGLDNSIMTIKKNQQTMKQRQSLSLQIIHIQFKNFIIKTETKQFRQFKKRNIQNWGQILQILKEIQKYIKKYNIFLVFVDGRKIISYSLCLTKLSENDIKDCIVGSSSQKHKHQSLKRISNGPSKQKMALQIITKLFKANVMRKQYQKTQFIKASKQRIANWIACILERRKTRAKIRQNNEIRNIRINAIQKQFQENYSSIIAQKHFQIHIPSHLHTEQFDFPQKLNTEITRIFNLKPNINIIYISPIEMSEQTINYYYKIMQLGQVQNFKERVKFINCQKNSHLDNETLSKRVYYNSKTIREIKNIIFGSKAVLVNGQCQEAHWYLVDSLKVPSVTNFRKYDLMKRSSPLSIFRTLDVPYLPFIKIDPLLITDFNLNQLTRKLSNFVTDNKLKTITIKLNSESQSFATIKCPFRNYDDLMQKTKIYHSCIFSSPNLFFKELLKVGGVAQKLQQFRYLSSLVYISPIKTITIFGTFQRIKTVDYTTIGACFPQQVVQNQDIVEVLQTLGEGLIKDIGFYGYAQIHFVVDKTSVVLQGIDWGLNQIGSSLFYFQYLASAKQTAKGLYESQVLQSQNSIVLTQYRYFVYCPYVLHFGLNQSQLRNFFQLCRSQGISFDLEKKYGSAFTLLQGVKNALGILATGKSIQVALGLIVQAINFIYRQTYKNNSDDRELRTRDRLQQYYNRGVYD